MHIADVQLDEGDARALDCGEDGHASVSEGPCVQYDASELAFGLQLPGLVQPIHQCAFVIALSKLQRKTMDCTSALAQCFYVCKCLRTIDMGLAGTQ